MRLAFLLAVAASPFIAASASADVSMELTYEDVRFRTMLQVVEPEGATCTVNGAKKQDAPFAFNAEPHMYYAISCLLPTGEVWQKKIEAKKGMIGVIRLKGGAAVAAVAPVKIVVAAGPSPMTPGAFSALVKSVDQASFSSDKIALVQAAAAGNHFTVAQLGTLVDASTHSSDKLKTAEIVAPKIIDRQNAFQLGARFTFSSDKEKVLELFR